LMYLRDNGYQLPSGAILMSPWVGAWARYTPPLTSSLNLLLE
jgi:hypothetical protein